MRTLTTILFCIAFAAHPATAQEVTALGGWMQDHSDSHEKSFSWQLEYREGLGEHFAYSISYLNEGHIPNHHRDGHSVQLWVRTSMFDRRLSIEAGAGPLFFYDTTRAEVGDAWSNDHNWGALLSLGATWYSRQRWVLQTRANWNHTVSSFDALTFLFGIGYQLVQPPVPGPLTQAPPQRQEKSKNEVTVFFGQTIVNSFGSECAYATSIEYRRSLLPAVDWTVGFLYEGENDTFRRKGVVTELWGVRSFFQERFSIGIGGGGYFLFDRPRYTADSRADEISPIVTLTAGYRFLRDWGIRASWHRIITSYDRDTDVILGGLGYHF